MKLNKTLLHPVQEDGGMEDPLAENVQDTNTDWPVLPAKVYELRISKAEKGATKAAEGKNPGDEGYAESITLTLETVKEHRSEKGEPIAAGHVFKHRIAITPKPEREEDGRTKKAYTFDDIKRSIAAPAKSAGLSETARAIVNNPTLFQGKTVYANIGIKKAEGLFPRGNQVVSFEVKK